jgi:hypothetical protein
MNKLYTVGILKAGNKDFGTRMGIFIVIVQPCQHFFLNWKVEMLRALRQLNESERKLAFILGFLLFLAGLFDLLRLGLP